MVEKLCKRRTRKRREDCESEVRVRSTGYRRCYTQTSVMSHRLVKTNDLLGVLEQTKVHRCRLQFDVNALFLSQPILFVVILGLAKTTVYTG